MLLRKKSLALPSVLASAATFLFGSALEARPPIVGQVTLTQEVAELRLIKGEITGLNELITAIYNNQLSVASAGAAATVCD